MTHHTVRPEGVSASVKKTRFLFVVAVPMVNVEAVLGHRATLPCDISANRTDDRVQMVMWFQVSASKPLFT